MMPRHTGLVSLAVLSFMAVIFLLACVLSPHWAKRIGLDVWNLPDLREALKQEGDRHQILQDQKDQILHEIEFSEYIAGRLIDGTMTLTQATNEVEPIMRNRPGFDTTWEFAYRVHTVRQGVARYLIIRVEALMNTDSRWPALSARLEAECATIK
jgi:hypothetical protein